MKRIAKLVTLTVLFAAAACAYCASVVGKWNGRFVTTFVAPAGVTVPPESIKKLNDFLGKVQIVLTIRKDGSYTAVTKAPGKPDQSSNGKWVLKGKQLTMTPASDATNAKTGTVSTDGKTLKMSLPKDMADHGVKGAAVFKRAS